MNKQIQKKYSQNKQGYRYIIPVSFKFLLIVSLSVGLALKQAQTFFKCNIVISICISTSPYQVRFAVHSRLDDF